MNKMQKKPPKPAQNGKARLIMAVGFGNFLETFDFTVYSYFSTLIGLVILNSSDPVFSTYISTILFGLGFLARPLGSVALGSYADKYGRKKALFATIMLMGLGSALIAFAPPYAALGWGAAALVLLGRLLQGFSAGGEIGSASALLLESAQESRRGFYIAGQFATQGVSAAAGALCAFILFSSLSAESMAAWGWRAPFVLALLIIPVGLYIRAHIAETYQGSAAETAAKIAAGGLRPHNAPHRPRLPQPLREIWAHYRRPFLLAILLVMPITLMVYILVLYMPTYLSLIRIESGAAALSRGSGRYLLTAGCGGLLTAAAFLGGFVCDKVRNRKFIAIFCLIIAFAACFALYALIGRSFIGFLAALGLAVLMLGMLMTIQALLVLEAFPRPVRATGMAVSIAAGATLFGGTAQIIITKIMMLTGQTPFAPFYYLGPMLLISLIAYAAFEEKHYP